MVANDPEAVTLLTELGITERVARLALDKTGGDIPKAADLALSSANQQDEFELAVLLVVGAVGLAPDTRVAFAVAAVARMSDRNLLRLRGMRTKPAPPSPDQNQWALVDSPSPPDEGGGSPGPLLERALTSSPKLVPRRVAALTPQELNQQASQLILSALERTASNNNTTTSPKSESSGSRTPGSTSFGRLSLSAMMPSISISSLKSRDKDKDRDGDGERGRSNEKKDKTKLRASSAVAKESHDESQLARARSSSPFTRRRSRGRDRSPSVEALRQDDGESDGEGVSSARRRRTAFATTDDEGEGDDNDEDADSDDSLSSKDHFDPVTEENTEKNAEMFNVADDNVAELPDPLGEGVNVVRLPEPYFNTNAASRTRKKSTRHDHLSLTTGRPQFLRDRCTIVLRQGDVILPSEEFRTGKRRRYFVASDLSEESKYAVEWAVGTVLRDGDELIIISVQESETKLDDPTGNATDRVAKIRNQQERHTLAFLLVRQVTALLQRTKLRVTVICQALHARKVRPTLLDLIDVIEPTMVIVGSRGRGQLKGILLGSTSHYLIQKSAVPVMVARRRLKRYIRKDTKPYIPGTSPRKRVSLAEAAIDKVGPGRLDQDVQAMREQIGRDEEAELAHQAAHPDGHASDSDEGEPQGVKSAAGR